MPKDHILLHHAIIGFENRLTLRWWDQAEASRTRRIEIRPTRPKKQILVNDHLFQEFEIGHRLLADRRLVEFGQVVIVA